MYQESHSSIRKAISDCALLALVFVLFLSGSFMILNGDTAGKLPEVVKVFLSGICFLAAILILYGLIYQVRRISNFRGDWLVELNGDSIRLETPDDEEVEPFEFDSQKIRKLSREAYDDDGIWYKWFIYTEDDGNELKKQFELGPFSEEKIADKMNRFYGIKTVEVDIRGEIFEWRYSLWFRLKELLSSTFGALIFISFIIPGFFYLVKVIKGLSG